MKAFARRGAEARIAELNAELAEIYRAFPALKQNQDAPFTRRGRQVQVGEDGESVAQTERVRRKRRKMTADQRKAVGERMRTYWAARRAATSGKKR